MDWTQRETQEQQTRKSNLLQTPLEAAVPRIRTSKNDPSHVLDVTFRLFCGRSRYPWNGPRDMRLHEHARVLSTIVWSW